MKVIKHYKYFKKYYKYILFIITHLHMMIFRLTNYHIVIENKQKYNFFFLSIGMHFVFQFFLGKSTVLFSDLFDRKMYPNIECYSKVSRNAENDCRR